MDGVQKTYQFFHNFLTQFTSSVNGKLKPDACDCLKDIDVITKIIQPDDSAFTSEYDPERVIKCVMLVTNVADVISENLSKFILDDEQGWWEQQQGSMNMWSAFTVNQLAALRLEASSQGIEVVSAGLGSINTGTFNDVGSDTINAIMRINGALTA